ncbi:LmeA family phospholipid-binding protein [Streptomyces hundungensis]|uniref:LmeA family phospholipid-binding protein n=1 Tax=Streptomyces hundungensis TaxID=1077946 RepID=UPI0033D538D1
MRTPTRMQPRYRNPYDELAALADPEPDPHPDDEPWTDPNPALDPGADPASGTRSGYGSGPATQRLPEAIPGQTWAGRPTVGDAPTDGIFPTADAPGPEGPAAGHPRTGPGDDFFTSPSRRRRASHSRRTRRGRRRRGSLLAAVPRATKLLIALVVGAGFLVLGDRCAVMYAEKKAQQALQSELGLAAAPQVDIHGFPFLTQVLDKRLERVDVTVPHVPADRVSLAKVRAGARDIELTGDLPSDISGAVIGSLNGEITLAFDDMNRELAASQVKFSRKTDNTVGADGKLTIAGQELRVSAAAQLRLDGDQGLSTDIDGMSLDMPGIATYRPGRDRGLTLHRESVELIARDTARVKALLSVPAVVKRLGLPDKDVQVALRDEEKLHELAGTPRFAEQLTHVNLVDVVADHPWLLSRIGIDPKLIAGLLALRPPELSDRLSFSFTLPKEAHDLRLRDVRVEKNGIVATVSGTGLKVGKGT